MLYSHTLVFVMQIQKIDNYRMERVRKSNSRYWKQIVDRVCAFKNKILDFIDISITGPEVVRQNYSP